MSHIHKHFCWFCNKHETCKQEECDFREEFQIHGFCMEMIRVAMRSAQSVATQNTRLIKMIESLGYQN